LIADRSTGMTIFSIVQPRFEPPPSGETQELLQPRCEFDADSCRAPITATEKQQAIRLPITWETLIDLNLKWKTFCGKLLTSHAESCRSLSPNQYLNRDC